MSLWPSRRATRAVLVCTLGGAGLLGGPATWICWPDAARVLAGVLLGAVLGGLAAPLFAPAAFRHAAWFQVAWGAGVGAGGALLLGASVGEVLMVAVIGGVVGWLAPVWLSRI